MHLVPLKSLGAATLANGRTEILSVPGEWIQKSEEIFEDSHNSLELLKLKSKISLASEL